MPTGSEAFMKNRKEFDQQLLETGMLHRRMAVDEEDSLEYRSLRQAAEKTEFLWDGIGTEVWETKGMGTLSFLPGGILRLETNARSDTWPEVPRQTAITVPSAHWKPRFRQKVLIGRLLTGFIFKSVPIVKECTLP